MKKKEKAFSNKSIYIWQPETKEEKENKEEKLKIKNYNVSSFFLTICSIIFLFIGNSLFKEDNVNFLSMSPYIISFILALIALIYSIIGIKQKNVSAKYLSAAIYVYVAICLSYFFYLQQ